jgi:hypothetical protein
MSDTPKERQSPKAGRTAASGGRQARLAAALRANLARRKAQERQRAPAAARPVTTPEERG